MDAIMHNGTKEEMEIKNEIIYYKTLPYEFEGFIDLSPQSDGEIEIVCVKQNPAIPEKKYVPAYIFEIRRDNICIGDIGLRIGYTEGLYYGGNIGYSVAEGYRGHSYAAKACRLLIPLMKMHKMTKVYLTNNHTNIASKRTCEKIGARFIRIVSIPEWHELYAEGQRYENIFEWTIN